MSGHDSRTDFVLVLVLDALRDTRRGVIGLVIDVPAVLVSRGSIMRQSIETIRSRSSFSPVGDHEARPSAASLASMRFRATKVSRQAAHSSAEPRAISRKRRRSARDRFHPFGYHEARPFPSAMLFEMETLASSRCFVALVRLFFNEPLITRNWTCTAWR